MNAGRVLLPISVLAAITVGAAVHRSTTQSGLTVERRTPPHDGTAVPASDTPVRPARAAAAAPRAAAHGEVRAQIRQAIEREASRLTGREGVERYLDQLEQQAQTNGRVSALEVEPGVAAIEGLAGELGPAATAERVAVFTERMRVLSARLDSRPLAPVEPDMEALADHVARARDEASRQDAIREYLAAANHLAPAVHPQAIERLNRAVWPLPPAAP